MSMIYFKSSDGSLVAMDGETSIDVSRSNTIASSSVMSTRTVSDEVIQGNLVISVTGLVTYSKTPTQQGNPTPEEWIDLIEAAISSKLRFTLYSTKYVAGKPLLKDYSNMVISDYGYTVDRFEDTITARITFNEVFVSDPAKQTYLPPKKSSSAEKDYPSETKNGKGTSTNVEKESASILYKLLTTDEGE